MNGKGRICCCKKLILTGNPRDSLMYLSVPGEIDPPVDKFERLGQLTSQLGSREFISMWVVIACKAYMCAVSSEDSPFSQSRYKTRLKGVSLSQGLTASLDMDLMKSMALRARGSGGGDGCMDDSELDDFYARFAAQTSHDHVASAHTKARSTGKLHVPQTRFSKNVASLTLRDASAGSCKVIQGVFDKRVVRYPADLSNVHMVTSVPFGYVE